MLSCCHCLCGKERSAAKRLDQCYPLDDRPDPVSSHVRELISWGKHDVARFGTIYDLLDSRVRNDISHKNVNSTSVGVKILGELIKNVAEIQANISQILVNVTILLIKTQQPAFLDIADIASTSIIDYTDKIKIRNHVTNIIKQYLKHLKAPSISDKIYGSVSNIIERATVNNVPVGDILIAIKDEIPQSSGAHSVIVAIARGLVTTTLPNFSDTLFQFFTDNNIWAKPDTIQSIMKTMINEMKEKISISFFKLWLEKLPPRSPDTGNSEVIIMTSEELFNSIPPERLISNNETDPLNMLFYFILRIPNLEYSNKKEIEDHTFTLCKSISSYYSSFDVASIAHHQLWVSIPAGEEAANDYDVQTVTTIFKFNTMFDAAMGNNLTKKMIKEGLKRIVQFFLYFKNHHKDIFLVVLKYLKSLSKLLPNQCIETIIPTLLALQKDVKKIPESNQLTFHTFIMCAMQDATSDAPKGARKYVASIIKQRLAADPVQADTKISFFKKYFPDYKKPSKKDKEKSKAKETKKTKNDDDDEEEEEEGQIVLFDKDKLMTNYKDLNNRSSIFRTINEIMSIQKEEEEDDDDAVEEDEDEHEKGPDMVIFKTGESDSNNAEDRDAGNEDSDEISETKLNKEREKAFDFIDNIEFSANSPVP